MCSLAQSALLYHTAKHGEGLSTMDYLTQANNTIALCPHDNVQVTLSQEGKARFLKFSTSEGCEAIALVILHHDGRVILATYMKMSRDKKK